MQRVPANASEILKCGRPVVNQPLYLILCTCGFNGMQSVVLLRVLTLRDNRRIGRGLGSITSTAP